MSGKENRKTYHKPQLQELGDLRSLTLGGSPGIRDSGTSRSRRPLGGMPQSGGFPRQPGNVPPNGQPPSGVTGY
jgi:hypothetical protein